MKKFLPYIANFFYTLAVCLLITTIILSIFLALYNKFNKVTNIKSIKDLLSRIFLIIYPLALLVFTILTKRFTVDRVSTIFIPLCISDFVYCLFKYLIPPFSLTSIYFYMSYLAIPIAVLMMQSTPMKFSK